MLRIRGRAYQATYTLFGKQKYLVHEYSGKSSNMSLLGNYPSWKADPGLSRKCAVFEKHGFTFQRALSL